MKKIRTPNADDAYIKSAWLADRAIEDNMHAYFGRTGDGELVRSKIITLYGTAVKTVEDPKRGDATENNSLQVYVDVEFAENVNVGTIENLSVGFGHRVSGALGTLFTEVGNKFSLTHPTVEDVTPADELLHAHRDAGGFSTSLVKADRLSVRHASSAILLSYGDESIDYKVLRPRQILPLFAEAIIEEEIGRDGEPIEKTRPPDTKNIEDAYVVIILLSANTTEQTNNYLAIYGRSRLYPNGRWVYYTAKQPDEIPGVGQDGANDYTELTDDGTECNPLSWYANQHPELKVPEYPIVVIDGGVAESDDALPMSRSLYDISLQIDAAASHLLSTSQAAARGTNALNREEKSVGYPLPTKLSGDVALYPGQSLEHINHGAGESVQSMDVIKELMIQAGASYSVPDYMVVTEDHTLDASSGVALAIKARPLQKKREERVDDNRAAIRGMFQKEKALIAIYSQSPDREFLAECEQDWNAGDLILPTNKKEDAERVTMLMDKGLLDTIGALRELNNLPSDEDAIELYEKMAERKKKYPSLAEQPKKQLGLLRNQQQQPQGFRQ